MASLRNITLTPLGLLQYEAARHARRSSISSSRDSTINYHLDQAIGSYKSPMSMFRTLDEFEDAANLAFHPPQPYHVSEKATPALNASNCHNGQRKLAMGFIEFVCNYMQDNQNMSDEPVVIIYAGASASACASVSKLFPHLQIIMFDYATDLAQNGQLLTRVPSARVNATVITTPNKASRENELRRAICVDRDRLIACTEGAGEFDDDVAGLVVDLISEANANATPSSEKAKVLFVSDIRRDESGEEMIAEDMAMQKRWVEITGCERFMLKFRMPYKWTPKILDAYGSSGGKGKINYLGGSLYLQLYPPANSAELRLVGSSSSSTTDVKANAKEYDVGRIEDAVNLFNNVYRSHAVFGPEEAKYESVAEDAILRAAAELTGRDLAQVILDVDSVVPTIASNCALDTAIKRLNTKELHRETRDLIDMMRVAK